MGDVDYTAVPVNIDPECVPLEAEESDHRCRISVSILCVRCHLDWLVGCIEDLRRFSGISVISRLVRRR